MADTWTVFINNVDKDLYDQGYLQGIVNTENKSICVLSVNEKSQSSSNENIQLVGRLQNDAQSTNDIDDVTMDLWVVIATSETGIRDCRVYANQRRVKCTCILYNPSDLQESYLFLEKSKSRTRSKKSESRTRSEKSENQRRGLCRGSVLLDVCHSLRFIQSSQLQLFSNGLLFVFGLVQLILSYLGVICLCRGFLRFSQFLYRKWSVDWAQKHKTFPACLTQLKIRANFIVEISDYHTKTPLEKLRCQNLIWSHVVDCILGVVLLLVAWKHHLHDGIVSSTVDWTKDIAERLSELIYWLMGAPAGLKLNKQLTQLMGYFFLYHVNLWAGYVALVQPLMSCLVYLAVPISVLGLSFQLSLLQDVVSLLTLHIYCFYVYAARLYNIEMMSIASLWRLFRGKKWNILRERVDSASYDVDQLFFGTLLLTILIFLLPTILLYYLVFLAFRILVLCAHGVLSFIIQTLNTIQIYTIVAWFIKSPSISGSVEFNIKSYDEDCLFLTMTTSQLPLKKVLEITRTEKEKKTRRCGGFSELFSSITHGRLLYPWDTSYNKQKTD